MRERSKYVIQSTAAISREFLKNELKLPYNNVNKSMQFNDGMRIFDNKSKSTFSQNLGEATPKNIENWEFENTHMVINIKPYIKKEVWVKKNKSIKK